MVKNPDTGVVEPTVMTVTADKFRVLLSGTLFTLDIARVGFKSRL